LTDCSRRAYLHLFVEVREVVAPRTGQVGYLRAADCWMGHDLGQVLAGEAHVTRSVSW
jgi:hypothetical protein